MQTYVWRCRTCSEEIPSDPKTWPMLASFHRLVHALEDGQQKILERLTREPTVALDLEVVSA